MRRRAETERPPMPSWVLLAGNAELDRAKEWAVAAGYSPLEWLMASSTACREHREATWAQMDGK